MLLLLTADSLSLFAMLCARVVGSEEAEAGHGLGDLLEEHGKGRERVTHMLVVFALFVDMTLSIV